MPEEPTDLPSETPGLTPELTPAIPSAALPPRAIWGGRDLLWLALFIPAGLLCAALMVSAGYLMARPIAGWHSRVHALQGNAIFLLVQQSIFYALILAFLSILVRVRHQQPLWRSLGGRIPSFRQVVEYLAGGGILAVLVSVLLRLRPDAHAFPLERLFDSRFASYAIGAFAISLAPLVEEVIFRGVLFAVIEGAAGRTIAVLITATLFAGLHAPEYWQAWNHLGMILLVGIAFSLARAITGSLTPSILLHCGFNAFIMLGLFLSTDRFHGVTSLGQ